MSQRLHLTKSSCCATSTQQISEIKHGQAHVLSVDP
jgi:hypothetical protein